MEWENIDDRMGVLKNGYRNITWATMVNIYIRILCHWSSKAFAFLTVAKSTIFITITGKRAQQLSIFPKIFYKSNQFYFMAHNWVLTILCTSVFVFMFKRIHIIVQIHFSKFLNLFKEYTESPRITLIWYSILFYCTFLVLMIVYRLILLLCTFFYILSCFE